MSHATDFWYVRFPDGRVLRATSTAVVRQHLSTGRIPAASTVRRSPDEEWVALSWTEEFADLAAAQEAADGPSRRAARERHPVSAGEPSTVASRMDPTQLQLVGVRAIIQELQAALDATLVLKKLQAAAVAALLLGVVAAVSRHPAIDLWAHGGLAAWCLAASALAVVAAVTALLTRMTYVELSQLRPARWREAFAGMGGLSIRVAVAQGLVVGAGVALIVLLRWLPFWVLAGLGGGPVVGAAVVVALVLEVAVWPVFAFALLLGPILVVENCGPIQCLREWWRLLRRHFARAYLYEAMAAALAVVLTLPLAFPLLAFVNLYLDERMVIPALFTRDALVGVFLGPFLANLVVSNVFIYLNLRYEYGRK